jgi:hypothetical protein
VLAEGNDPQEYAEGILKVCRAYLQSPLACVAGVSGGGLKARIDAIMENRLIPRLNAVRKLVLSASAVLVLVPPLILGLSAVPVARIQAKAAQVLTPIAQKTALAPTTAAPNEPAPSQRTASALPNPIGPAADNGPETLLVPSPELSNAPPPVTANMPSPSGDQTAGDQPTAQIDPNERIEAYSCTNGSVTGRVVSPEAIHMPFFTCERFEGGGMEFEGYGPASPLPPYGISLFAPPEKKVGVTMTVQFADPADAGKMHRGERVTLRGDFRAKKTINLATKKRFAYLSVANAKVLHGDPFASDKSSEPAAQPLPSIPATTGLLPYIMPSGEGAPLVPASRNDLSTEYTCFNASVTGRVLSPRAIQIGTFVCQVQRVQRADIGDVSYSGFIMNVELGRSAAERMVRGKLVTIGGEFKVLVKNDVRYLVADNARILALDVPPAAPSPPQSTAPSAETDQAAAPPAPTVASNAPVAPLQPATPTGNAPRPRTEAGLKCLLGMGAWRCERAFFENGRSGYPQPLGCAPQDWLRSAGACWNLESIEYLGTNAAGEDVYSVKFMDRNQTYILQPPGPDGKIATRCKFNGSLAGVLAGGCSDGRLVRPSAAQVTSPAPGILYTRPTERSTVIAPGLSRITAATPTDQAANYDKAAVPSANVALRQAQADCKARLSANEIKNYSEFAACSLAAEYNFFTAINFKRMDTFEAYADSYQALAADRDARRISDRQAGHRANNILSRFYLHCNCNAGRRDGFGGIPGATDQYQSYGYSNPGANASPSNPFPSVAPQ